MYAIVKTGGKQYTVKPGDVLDVEKLDGEAGDKVALDVIFLNDGKNVVTDADKLAKTTVTAEIVDQHKGDKQLIFKFKKRKGYKRTRGHRQQLTRLAIVDVNGEKAAAPAKKAAPKQEEAPKEAVAEPAKAAAAVVEQESVDFEKMTVSALKDYAKEHDIKLPSGARKAEIIEIISNAE